MTHAAAASACNAKSCLTVFTLTGKACESCFLCPVHRSARSSAISLTAAFAWWITRTVQTIRAENSTAFALKCFRKQNCTETLVSVPTMHALALRCLALLTTCGENFCFLAGSHVAQRCDLQTCFCCFYALLLFTLRQSVWPSFTDSRSPFLTTYYAHRIIIHLIPLGQYFLTECDFRKLSQ